VGQRGHAQPRQGRDLDGHDADGTRSPWAQEGSDGEEDGGGDVEAEVETWSAHTNDPERTPGRQSEKPEDHSADEQEIRAPDVNREDDETGGEEVLEELMEPEGDRASPTRGAGGDAVGRSARFNPSTRSVRHRRP
jgi:hypothetical protein